MRALHTHASPNRCTALTTFRATRFVLGLRRARERARQALLAYEGTLQQSFREVEDSLVAVRTYKVEHEAQVRRAFAAHNAARLSRARYDGGVTDYLEVLDSERTLFSAQLDKSATLREYYNAIVQLYAALGGGWSVENQGSGK